MYNIIYIYDIIYTWSKMMILQGSLPTHGPRNISKDAAIIEASRSEGVKRQVGKSNSSLRKNMENLRILGICIKIMFKK